MYLCIYICIYVYIYISLRMYTYVYIRVPCTNAAKLHLSVYHLSSAPITPYRSMCLSANEQGQWAEVARDGFVQIHLASL